ncbi:MAG: hypothetical protein QXP36_02405 [Conexivisphaerales archaeon]
MFIVKNNKITQEFINLADRRAIPITGESLEFYESESGKKHILLRPGATKLFLRELSKEDASYGIPIVLRFVITAYTLDSESGFVKKVSIAPEIQKLVMYFEKNKRDYNIGSTLLLKAYNSINKSKGILIGNFIFKKGITVKSSLFKEVADLDLSEEHVFSFLNLMDQFIADITNDTYDAVYAVLSNFVVSPIFATFFTRGER